MLVEPFTAEVSSYAGLREAIRRRVEALNISRITLDSIAGLTPGRSAKLLSSGEAKEPKRFGLLSLELILQATGLKLLVVDDHKALARFAPMYVKRDVTQVRLHNTCRKSKGRRKARPSAAARNRKTAKPKRGKPFLSR